MLSPAKVLRVHLIATARPKSARIARLTVGKQLSGNREIRFVFERNVTGTLSNWTVSVLSSGLEAGGPAHGGAVGTGQGNSSGSGTAGAGGEDLYTLEAEITELQRENARVESQVLRLRSDITAMENQLKHGDKVSLCSVGSIPCVDK